MVVLPNKEHNNTNDQKHVPLSKEEPRTLPSASPLSNIDLIDGHLIKGKFIVRGNVVLAVDAHELKVHLSVGIKSRRDVESSALAAVDAHLAGKYAAGDV